MRIAVLFLAVLMPGLSMNLIGQEYQEGIQVTFTGLVGDGETDLDVRPNIWLSVPEGGTASPFLKPGPFRAQFDGYLNLELRGVFYFQAELNGKAVVQIDGETVFEEELDGGMTELSTRVRLDKGLNPMRVVFTSPGQGNGRLRLLWQPRRSFPRPIPSDALVHETSEALEHALARRNGRRLALELRCFHCHSAPMGDLPETELDAPSFAGIGSRLTPEWLKSVILEPDSQGAMPRLLHGGDAEERASDIADFLAGLKEENEALVQPEAANVELMTQGERLFNELHCTACHAVPGAPLGDSSKRPLDHVGRKFNPGFLREYLLNPDRHYRWNPMPDFQLSEEEVDVLAAYLIGSTTHTHGGEEADGNNSLGNAGRGRQLVQTLGCLNCHEHEMENTFTAPAASAFDDLTTGCLGVGETAPDFNLSVSERAALRQFLGGGLESLLVYDPVDFARRQMDRLQCIECHDHQIDAVPHLSLLGEKLKPEWASRLIGGSLEYRPRPWLTARMPAFREAGSGIATGMALLHGHPETAPLPDPIDRDLAEIGKQLIGADGGFACTACHGVGQPGGHALAESPGIDLTYVAERLRHDFFVRWMLDPLQVDPATRMPAFFQSDGGSPLFEVYGGDGCKQIEAIWQYLRKGGGMETVLSPVVAPNENQESFE